LIKYFSREDDVVRSLDEVYKIGSFTQIHEIQDLGDRLRMVVMGHRRIMINGIAADLNDFQKDLKEMNGTSVIEEKILKNGLRRRLKKASETLGKTEDTVNKIEEQTFTSTPVTPSNPESPKQILMVETSNLIHVDYKQTEEIKAMTNEVIKTIRDIIAMNPLYK
jgi:Lon-like ATP-dependent protease